MNRRPNNRKPVIKPDLLDLRIEDLKDRISMKEDEIRRQEAKDSERVLYCFDTSDIQQGLGTGTTTRMDSGHDDFHAVALIGDRFYKDKFLSMVELQKSYKTLERSYHDINHWGTTYMDGNPNIEYIIGYQDNVRLDPKTKALTADIHILKSSKHYDTWRGFVDINKAINRTPNVSVSFYSSKKNVRAGDLPIDFVSHGYSKDDKVAYLYDIEFQALSTVFKGACSDKEGCGIGMNYHHSSMSESELMLRIKQIRLQKKIKGFKGE